MYLGTEQVEPGSLRRLNMSLPSVQFLLHGGYAYFDDKGAFLLAAVNPAQGSGLHASGGTDLAFLPPRRWKHEYTPYLLAQKDRVHAVTNWVGIGDGGS